MCIEGILQLFINFYLKRKLSIFLRIDRDCKDVDPYNRLPQDWPHGGIQRINWPANRSRFLTKCLKRGHVHNLDSLKKELSNKNNQKTNTTSQLYWPLSTQVCKTKTYFPPEPKTDTTAQLEKKFLQPTRSKCIRSSVSHSVCPSVRAKRGKWSKRVFMRANGYFSFSVH